MESRVDVFHAGMRHFKYSAVNFVCLGTEGARQQRLRRRGTLGPC